MKTHLARALFLKKCDVHGGWEVDLLSPMCFCSMGDFLLAPLPSPECVSPVQRRKDAGHFRLSDRWQEEEVGGEGLRHRLCMFSRGKGGGDAYGQELELGLVSPEELFELFGLAAHQSVAVEKECLLAHAVCISPPGHLELSLPSCPALF